MKYLSWISQRIVVLHYISFYLLSAKQAHELDGTGDLNVNEEKTNGLNEKNHLLT